MRLFIAAELPEHMRESLAETLALLRGCVRGRYVATDSLHITLAFLGEVERGRIDRLCALIDGACAAFGSFDVSLGGFGSFGKRSKATLWQGFDDAGSLPALATSIRTTLGENGFAFDEKGFKPHVTLMRAADLSAGSLPSPMRATGTVSRITLFRSDLSGDRPVYELLHVSTLSA